MSKSFLAHLVVEGNSDFAVFRQHIRAPAALSLRAAHGSPNALACRAAIQATQAKSTAYAAVRVHYFIDQDYRIAQKWTPPSDVTVTDAKDFECMMIASEAFETVATEIICPTKLAKASMSLADVRNQVVQGAAILGAIRFASERHTRDIDFKRVNPTKFVNFKDLSVDLSKLATHLGSQNQHTTITVDTINADVHAAKSHGHFTDNFLLASGHDIVDFLSCSVKEVLKPKGLKADTSRGTIEAMLRIAYKDLFISTACYKRVVSQLLAQTGRNDLLAV